MAKKRILKKEIYCVFEEMLFDVLMCQSFAPNADEAKIESVISRINQKSAGFICRAHHAPSGENNKVVKQYYQKLVQDLDNEIELISQEIEALSKCPDKQKI